MKYNYCPKCDKAYLKSRLERDRCVYCNSACETVDVRRNGLYYMGYGIMMGGAASAILPRYMDVSGTAFFFALGIALVVAGSVFVLMGSGRMAETARERVLGGETELLRNPPQG